MWLRFHCNAKCNFCEYLYTVRNIMSCNILRHTRVIAVSNEFTPRLFRLDQSIFPTALRVYAAVIYQSKIVLPCKWITLRSLIPKWHFLSNIESDWKWYQNCIQYDRVLILRAANLRWSTIMILLQQCLQMK